MGTGFGSSVKDHGMFCDVALFVGERSLGTRLQFTIPKEGADIRHRFVRKHSVK